MKSQAGIIDEIKQSIESINWGSVEVIVQDGEVTQISTRIIKKTKANLTNNKVAKKIKKAGKDGINLNFKY